MLPIQFDLANHSTSDTIKLLSSLLERMTVANDLLNKQQQKRQAPIYTRFHARLVPSIDIYSYLTRILKYCPCTNECFLSLLVYFDRMSKNSISLTGKPFTIDSFNIHRLIITGVMVASKFFSDVFYTNTRYAKVGGLSIKELNQLEIEFLKLNHFNLTVPISELQKYADQLLKIGYQDITKSFRHNRSNSFDQPKQEIQKLCDLTQRVSLDEHYGYQSHPYYYPQQVNCMSSTTSLNENISNINNNRSSQVHERRQSRSSVSLHQWSSSTSLDRQPSSSDESVTSRRKLSLTSIYAAPFIPNAQQQNHQGNGIYYYSIGIPTPPTSASPIYYQPSYSSMYL